LSRSHVPGDEQIESDQNSRPLTRAAGAFSVLHG
jgi:hypothetical protein